VIPAIKTTRTTIEVAVLRSTLENSTLDSLGRANLHKGYLLYSAGSGRNDSSSPMVNKRIFEAGGFPKADRKGVHLGIRFPSVV
jgi:hypothetical protein